MLALAPLLQIVKGVSARKISTGMHPAATTVADRVSRVLFSVCLGYDDGYYKFCDFCGIPAPSVELPGEEGDQPLKANEDSLRERSNDFARARAGKAGTKSSVCSKEAFDKFVGQRSGGTIERELFK